MSEHAVHAAIVFWRQSLWNGARCVPLLLSLSPDELRAQDRLGGIVFQEDPRALGGRLTRLGTLIITVRGQRYALVGRGGAQSPAPSAEQEGALTALRRESPGPAVTGGMVDQLLNGGAAARMRAWHTQLGLAGARLG